MSKATGRDGLGLPPLTVVIVGGRTEDATTEQLTGSATVPHWNLYQALLPLTA